MRFDLIAVWWVTVFVVCVLADFGVGGLNTVTAALIAGLLLGDHVFVEED